MLSKPGASGPLAVVLVASTTLAAGTLLSVLALKGNSTATVVGQDPRALASPTTSTSAGTSDVTSADTSKVQAVGYMLSTTVGTHVQVVHVKGQDVWARFFPDASIGADTETIKNHDMLVVRSTTNVPQGIADQLPGATPTAVGMVQLVIDATSGRVVEVTTAPTANDILTDDIRALGPSTDVTLTNVTAPPTS